MKAKRKKGKMASKFVAAITESSARMKRGTKRGRKRASKR